jgi:hypothetical protein
MGALWPTQKHVLTNEIVKAVMLARSFVPEWISAGQPNTSVVGLYKVLPPVRAFLQR